MTLAPLKNKICISIFIFISCHYPSNFGLKYCIYTCIFVGKLFISSTQAFTHFYFYSYLPTATFLEISHKP